MIVGTAGHIDHGKTALVKALTGVDADRLAEEKARGITIDLGFAYADLGGGAITGFIDVPGHEKFVHTMLAGAGGIDLALLVIAADDGIMPQTREHLAILDLLGIGRGIVALTKADLADADRLATLGTDIHDLLAGTTLAGSRVIPVSSLSGAGIDVLRDALAQAEAATLARATDRRFRMAIDRSFTISGAGTVVTGTVLSGRVQVGDQITISPLGAAARVRGIHAQNRKADAGLAGQRCALNLTGPTHHDIHRGDVALDPLLDAPTQRIDVLLRVLASEPKALTTWFPARLHLGASEIGARIVPLQGPLQPGDTGLAQIVLDRPVAATVQDRFILRDVSARRTIGGGSLIDLRPPARRRSRPERLAVLAAMQDSLPKLADLALVDLDAHARDHALVASDTTGVALLPGTHQALSPRLLAALRQKMQDELATYHAENPDLQGMGREPLRMILTPRIAKPDFTAFLRAEAAAGLIALDGAFIRLPQHLPRLSDTDETILAQILPMLRGDARFRPPRVRDLAHDLSADEAEIRRILRMAARQGRIDQIAHDHFFTRDTTIEMIRILRELPQQDGWFTAPDFRDRTQNGRKVAIQILDFFDKLGLTLRRGDLRRINPHRMDLFAADGSD
ncbi:selenocysteine-specific translation elongation factor [Paracoccus shanxieyensis]|uniref:Selenocysteine-specific elongation factor n=1 Tax=Paracoccus shanxieyensis TaxID=2675752 RepID=A0A6L6J6F1_9RHOB|nr:selenocysteine-specific translation elongation factor [Paracoccus shanxieyensis]MTH66357.1 selenocysteine-specific translation elongation factor [Paracoccus shanxieyensis]MTH89588.1 selenocysteine-specific translation elongation factor [Paracoccus shanxieyensis]